MKTKIKTLIILIAIFSVSLIAGICAGCIGEDDPKEKADALGMTACVTYYTNGGNFVSGTNSVDGKSYRTDYYYPDTPIFNIGGGDKTSGQSLTIKRSGYIFMGWAYALLDGDGLPCLYEPDGEWKATGTKLKVLENGTASIIDSTNREKLEKEKRFVALVDEERGLVFKNGHPKVGAGEHIYLVATWEKDVVLEYKLLTDAPIAAQVEVDAIEEGDKEENYVVDKEKDKIYKKVTYKNGDVIATESFALGTLIELVPGSAPQKFNDFTYIHLFWDSEGKQPVKDGETVTKHADKTNSVIYAKYLSGDNWETVKTVDDVKKMFAEPDYRYFVVYDIDCTEGEFSYNVGSYSGVIEGNGRVLSNISISYAADGNIERGSLLGNLTRSASIKNLIFENVNIELKIRGTIRAFVLLSGIREGGVIENVIINNVTFSIELVPNLDNAGEDRTRLYNIQKDLNGNYQTGNWLYGVYDTDAEFVENYGDYVQNATLIINGETIVSGGQL